MRSDLLALAARLSARDEPLLFIKGVPDKGKTIHECAFAAGLESKHYYDPPNLSFPFGSVRRQLPRLLRADGAGCPKWETDHTITPSPIPWLMRSPIWA